MAANAESRSERVDLRMTPSAKQTLQRAAAVTNKTLTEFLLDSGLHHLSRQGRIIVTALITARNANANALTKLAA